MALFRLLYLLTNVDDRGERGRWGETREGGFAFTEMFGHVLAPDADAAASARAGAENEYREVRRSTIHFERMDTSSLPIAFLGQGKYA